MFPKYNFVGMPLHTLKQIRSLYDEVEEKAPKNWAEVEQKIRNIVFNSGCPRHLLQNAIDQFKKRSTDWKTS